jgi:hypothetical protein
VVACSATLAAEFDHGYHTPDELSTDDDLRVLMEGFENNKAQPGPAAAAAASSSSATVIAAAVTKPASPTLAGLQLKAAASAAPSAAAASSSSILALSLQPAAAAQPAASTNLRSLRARTKADSVPVAAAAAKVSDAVSVKTNAIAAEKRKRKAALPPASLKAAAAADDVAAVEPADQTAIVRAVVDHRNADQDANDPAKWTFQVIWKFCKKPDNKYIPIANFPLGLKHAAIQHYLTSKAGVVESIVEHAGDKPDRDYCVKWKKFGSKFNTWIKAEDFTDPKCKILKAYERALDRARPPVAGESHSDVQSHADEVAASATAARTNRALAKLSQTASRTAAAATESDKKQKLSV